MRMSLRTRIAVWFAALMTVVIFALVFTAQHVMVASLRADLDERLQLHAEMVATALQSTPKATYGEVVRQLTEYQLATIPLFIRVADLQGNVIASFGDIPRSIILTLDRQLSLPGAEKGRFGEVQAENRVALRVYTIQARDPSNLQPFALIQTGESLASVTAAEDRLWRYVLIEGVVAALVILSIVVLTLRRGFQPLDRILKRVQEIRDTDLSAGLPTEPRPPELQRLADSLNTMWHRLDVALRAKEAFVASVSHELRTPLTAIQGQIDILRRRPANDSELSESLERTAREVNRLIRMTNNILLNAQLDSKATLTRQQVNLRELVEGVVKEMRVLAERRNFTLEEGEDVLISGDYDLLKQAVLNVVDNALKFTPEDGRIQLTLQQEGSWAILEVSDSGRGIPQKHLPHVTEPFYRASRSERNARGAGLGLAIVKQVVDLHGGKIHISSQEGAGTSVKICLPV
jgi:two-component system OmpR family sensor kinase